MNRGGGQDFADVHDDSETEATVPEGGAEEPWSLDLLLHWKDDVAPDPRLAEDVCDLGAADPTTAASVVTQHTASTVAAGADFQWTHDREQAIEAALRRMAEIPLARVHVQLDEIREALEAGLLAPEGARILLDEVDAWLRVETERRAARCPLADEQVTAARSCVGDALHVYLDTTDLLRGFLETGDPAGLVLARRLADQAAGFLLTARDRLLQAAENLPTEADASMSDAASSAAEASDHPEHEQRGG